MAIKLNRSVFIGLGGTGMTSILKTKQFYEETFGKVPEIIGFLGIDTSLKQFDEGLTIENGQKIKLENSESVKLKIEGPLEYYMRHKENFRWVPKANVQALSGLSADGAGQIRTNGRFSFTINYNQIENGIKNVVDRVSKATNDGKGKWELADGKIQIYLVFSLSGGTGCGTFLSTAMLLRDLYQDRVVIQAYGVLPSTFQGNGLYVGANAFGALLDTDYLMSMIDPDHPFKYALLNDELSCMYKPFDLIYLVDNVNKNGDKYTDSNQLYTMIGKALSEISGPLGDSVAADIDNFKQLLIDGSLDVEDKKSWICGLGLCEILVDTKKLTKKYALKASQKLVSDMVGHADPNVIDEAVSNFVNLNHIREHEDDQLIDSFYNIKSETDIQNSSINSSKADDAKIECDTFIDDTCNQAKKKIASAYDAMIESLKTAFDVKLSNITKESGLASATLFIKKLTEALNVYIEEMREEIVDLDNLIPTKKSDVDDIISQWKAKKFFQKAKFNDELADAQRDYVSAKIDRDRHDKALQFFRELKEYVNNFCSMIYETSTRLESVASTISDKITKMSFTNADVNPFQIDLASSYSTSNGSNDADCTVSKFAATLTDANVMSLQKLTSAEILEKIIAFTSNLAGANFEDLSLSKIILGMNEEDKKALFDKALRKAEIVLEHQAKGYGEPEGLRNNLYVSVFGGQNGLIANDPTIKNMLESSTGGSAKPKFSDIPSDQKIFILRQKGVYPVFQIASVMRQQRDFEKFGERKSFCIDSDIQAQLEDLHYTFEPNQQKDNDVLEMWVKGLLHGLIKRDGTRYYVYSPALCNGDGSNNYMYKLRGPEEGKGTEARFFAFEDFKANKKLLKGNRDLMGEIHKIEDAMGRTAITELYTKASACDYATYVLEYSQVSVSNVETLKSASYDKTRDLIKDEDAYRRTKLVASIDNR